MNCELMLTYDTPAYMFNVYKNQLSRQTASRNLTGPKTLPTIWHTYMKLATKYQISAIDSCWEKCDEKYLGRTDRGKTVYPLPPPVERGYNNIKKLYRNEGREGMGGELGRDGWRVGLRMKNLVYSYTYSFSKSIKGLLHAGSKALSRHVTYQLSGVEFKQ